MIRHKKASDIYKKQNTLLHKAFTQAGMPYQANKEVWLKLMIDIAKRPVTGLSELTLSERHQLISHLQRKGMRIFAPAVPEKIGNWKKGDPDIEYEYRVDDDPQIRMAYAMWAEMGYRPATLRGLCLKVFKVDDPRWLNDHQLIRLVNIVKNKANSKGYGAYYAR